MSAIMESITEDYDSFHIEPLNCFNSEIALIDWGKFDTPLNEDENNMSSFDLDEQFLNNIMRGLFNEEDTTNNSEVVCNDMMDFTFLDSNIDIETNLTPICTNFEFPSDDNTSFSFDETFYYDFYEPLEPTTDSNHSYQENIPERTSSIPKNLIEIFPHMNDENNRRRRNLLYESTCRNQIPKNIYPEPIPRKTDALVSHDYAQNNEEKTFFCPVTDCNKIYAKSSHLKAHLRRHSGEKPFVCDWQNCTWKFSRSDELARHKRSHFGIKPYKCDYCDKGFARSDHLAKHRKIHEKRNRTKLFSTRPK